MILLLAAAAAASFQDTASIDRAVAAFTTRPLGAEGGARSLIDPRLRLATCPMVSLSWRTEAHDAVVVSCTGPDWRIYVPVISTARPAPGAAAVAAAPKPGAPVIRRGDPVTIEAGSDGFSITRDGIALGDAAPGARFLVRVDGDTKPVQAQAIDTGRATLPGWM